MRVLMVAMIAAAAIAAPVESIAAPLRVIVLVTDDDDAALATRVEGQVADLDADVTRAASAPLPAELAGQLTAAQAVAGARGADAIVWFRRDDGGWIVHVAQAAGDRLLVRRVHEDDGGAMAGSAAIEAAAVIVRTAIRGLAAGGEIGVEEVPAAAPPVPTPAPVAIEMSSTRPLRPFAELGWAGVMDGERTLGQHGVAARLGAAGGPYRIAVVAAYLPTRYETREASIEVERQVAGVALGLDLVGAARVDRSTRWRIAADLALTMARFRRTTTTTSASLMPTAATETWTPIATPALRVARRLAPATWIALTLGVDLLARPPEFGVAGSGTFVPVASLWPVQPHAGVGIEVDPF